MNLGNKIRDIRKDNNLTQEQFAQKFHVTRQTVSNWENNKNYPDLSSLKMISEEYRVSFDELFKEDESYIKSMDETKSKMTKFKKAFIIAVILLIAVLVGFFTLLNIAFKPTPDAKRINSDTNVKMLVDLPGSTPSRAITFTTDKDKNDKSYIHKIEKYQSKVLGNVEGDIPCVTLNEKQKIILRFQNSNYDNIAISDVKGISADLKNVLSDNENKEKVKMKYIIKDGAIILDPTQIKYEKVNEEGEVWYNMSLAVEYQYKGNEYISITAVNIFDK